VDCCFAMAWSGSSLRVQFTRIVESIRRERRGVNVNKAASSTQGQRKAASQWPWVWVYGAHAASGPGRYWR